MSRYTKQSIIEEKGSKLLLNSLDERFFLFNEFSAKAGKDSYPDIDGQIRLRDGRGNYINKYLHYQLKSREQIRNAKFYCSRRLISYLIETNIPTLLFVVDVANETAYWYFLGKRQRKSLQLERDKKGRTVDLKGQEIRNNSPDLNGKWGKIANEDNYRALSDAFGGVIDDFRLNASKCLGLLYLLQKTTKDEVGDLFSQALSVSPSEAQLIVEKLLEKGIIQATANLYILDNEQLGQEALYELLTDFDLETLQFLNADQKRKGLMFRQLARTSHPKALEYLTMAAKSFCGSWGQATTNEEILAGLDLLGKYAFRVPDLALQIVNAIAFAGQYLPPTKCSRPGLGEIVGRSHLDLILSSLEILDSIRYFQTGAVSKILFDLSLHSTDTIRTKAKEVLKNLSQYNLFVLQKIGYDPQESLLDTIEAWNHDTLLERIESVLVIARELLQPSFEAHSTPDYKTFALHFGPLHTDQKLKDLRERTLALLEKLFSIVGDVPHKREILTVLNEASHPPIRGDYGRDLEKMVLNNTNRLVSFYINIVNGSDHEIISKIQEHTTWFVRRFRRDSLPGIAELESRIAANSEYDIFRVLVGYAHHLEDHMGWKEVDNIRQQKIQEYIGNIDGLNFEEWSGRVLSISRKYSSGNVGEFQYFNMFLFHLARRKPDLALQLIQSHEQELEPFLIHILAGLWKSASVEEARALTYEWVNNGQHLAICAYVFEYNQELDKDFLIQILRKAITLRDIQALNGIVGAILRNYRPDADLKKLFIKTIKELTKQGSCLWVQSIWLHENPIFADFSERDFDAILSNLLSAPAIEHYVEQVLDPVTTKFPLKCLAFFKKRMALQGKRQHAGRYDALPYRLSVLGDVLRAHVAIVFPELLRWVASRNAMQVWQGSLLIEELFSGFDETLEKELIRLLQTEEKKNAYTVLSILQAYKGEVFLHHVCKEFVKHFSNQAEYMHSLFGVLSQTGVVTGEYGFVKAYEQKKVEIEGWKDDPDESIRSFANEYTTFLNHRIDYEKKRADEDIELMKRGLR